MIVLVTLTIGLMLWIVAWALGIKAFDAFLFTAIITLLAAGVQMMRPHVQRRMSRRPLPGDR